MLWFGPVILIFIVLMVWRGFQQKYATLKFRYKIYALRDHLRKMAIVGEIDEDDWTFSYFDKSFSKAISESYYITIFHLLMLAIAHSKDEQLQILSEELTEALEKNPQLQSLQADYIDAVIDYMKDQHYVSVTFIFKPLISLIFGAAVMGYYASRLVRGILIYPETSASNKFTSKNQRKPAHSLVSA